MYKHATTFLDMDFIIFEGQLNAKNGHGVQLDTKNQQNLTHYNYATFFSKNSCMYKQDKFVNV